MNSFRRVLVNNSEVDTALPYFVGVESLQNHSINICLHVRRPASHMPFHCQDYQTGPVLAVTTTHQTAGVAGYACHVLHGCPLCCFFLKCTAILKCAQMHTTPPASRGFGGFRTRLLLQLCRVIEEHGAALSYPVQVRPETSAQMSGSALMLR